MPRTKQVLWALVAVALASGLAGAFSLEASTAGLLELLSLAAYIGLIFAWYYSDSEARSYPRSGALNFLMVIVVPLALPYYLFRSRGAKLGFLALSKCIAFLVLLWVVAIASGLVVAITFGTLGKAPV